MSKKHFQQTILRTALSVISQNQLWLEKFAPLANIQTIHYNKKKEKQKKISCIVCDEKFTNVLLLILHLQLQHKKGHNSKYIVEKYEISQNIMTIYEHNISEMDIQPHDFFVVNNSGQVPSTYIFKSQTFRTKYILSQIAKKISQEKIPQKIPQIQYYYHSHNIFIKSKIEDECVDSQQELATVQRQLYQLEINEFKDVNDHDKKFFAEWNTFVENYKAKGSVIYPHCLQNLLNDFVEQLALLSETDLRLNLVMHLWTLWSLGQIKSELIIQILQKYDNQRNLHKGKTN